MSNVSTFKVNSRVIRLKPDVLEDPASFVPTNLRKKIGYTGVVKWDKFIAHLVKPSTQSIIRASLPKTIPTSIVEKFRKYGLTNQAHLKRSIVLYLNQRYKTLSVLDGDVRAFVTKWPKRWHALTDTSVRDNIIEIYTQTMRREPTSFRLVVGYYSQDPDYDPDDKRPAATKKTLEALLRKPSTWTNFHKIFYNASVHDKDGRHYPVRIGQIKPSHITKIKVLPAPVHNPTLWETVTGKHRGWVYHPTLVAVIDVENIPLVKVTETPQKRMDAHFGQWVVALHMHSALSGDGWINQFRTSPTKKKDPFHGDLYLLQMGERVTPDYRQFVQKSF